MSNLTTIARPYSKAAFDFAEQHNALQQWDVGLQQLSLAVADLRIQKQLKRSNISKAAKVALLLQLIDNVPTKFDNLLHKLAYHNRLLLISNIYLAYHDLLQRKNKVLDVEIEVAQQLQQGDIDAIKQQLAEKLHCTINVKTVINTNLIGGGIIKIDNQIVDCSILGKLRKLYAII